MQELGSMDSIHQAMLKSGYLLHKITATLLPTRYVFTINETLQMRYCMKFYLKEHQKYKMLNF